MNRIIEKAPRGARFAIIGGGILLGVLLIAYPFGDKKSEKNITNSDEYFKVSSYTETLEERVKKLCLSVDGINEVNVLLTLESGSEYVYADNVKKDSVGDGGYSSDYLVINTEGGTSPVPVMEIYPKIRGIAVVCNGGNDPSVQIKVTELLSAALGLPSSKIRICG